MFASCIYTVSSENLGRWLSDKSTDAPEPNSTKKEVFGADAGKCLREAHPVTTTRLRLAKGRASCQSILRSIRTLTASSHGSSQNSPSEPCNGLSSSLIFLVSLQFWYQLTYHTCQGKSPPRHPKAAHTLPNHPLSDPLSFIVSEQTLRLGSRKISEESTVRVASGLETEEAKHASEWCSGYACENRREESG